VWCNSELDEWNGKNQKFHLVDLDFSCFADTPIRQHVSPSPLHRQSLFRGGGRIIPIQA
jgi:hypothetical protein